MLDFTNYLNTNSSSTDMDKLQKKTKFYWSLVRLFIGILCFRLNSTYDVTKAGIIFFLVIIEFITSKINSKTKANLIIITIFLIKLWVGSQIKENRLWLVPFSMFLQVNLYMHGLPVPILLMSSLTSLFFISTVEASFHSSVFQLDAISLDMMFSSLFKGYKILSFNLMIGLIIANCLFVNTVNKYAQTESKLKEAKVKLDDATDKYEEMLKTLDETNTTLRSSKNQLKQTKAELEVKSKELDDLIKADDMLLVSISHELRNPLNSMIGNIELLLMEVGLSKYKDMLEVSKISGEILLSHINNLLDVAKIKSGGLDFSPRPTKFLDLLAKAWRMNSIKILTKNLQGALHVSTNMPNQIILDSQRLTQILLNLIDNAVKFTTEGSVQVYVTWIKDDEVHNQDHTNNSFTPHSIPLCESYHLVPYKTQPSIPASIGRLKSSRFLHSDGDTSPSSSLVGLTEENCVPDSPMVNLLPRFKSNFISDLDRACYRKFAVNATNIVEQLDPLSKKKAFKRGTRGFLQIEVIDSGCGINKEVQRKLFKPFMQGDSSITRDKSGLGIGLFITKHLLEKMRGSITIVSEKNVGSNFCVRIPCDIKEEGSGRINSGTTASQIESLSVSQTIGSPKALIVDDNSYNQVILQNYLQKMNIQSEIANDGLQALQKFKQNSYDYSLIFMDLQMPVMDGFSASKAIRNYEAEIRMKCSVPIIIVTGNATDFEKKECLNPEGKIRASFFFTKPFSFAECEMCVKHVLNES